MDGQDEGDITQAGSDALAADIYGLEIKTM